MGSHFNRKNYILLFSSTCLFKILIFLNDTLPLLYNLYLDYLFNFLYNMIMKENNFFSKISMFEFVLLNQ